jgi:trimethylamine--corrinoid protein Co-methyltransferase
VPDIEATSTARAFNVKPRVTVLTPEQIDQVHEYSLQILRDVGVRVDSKPARQLFARAMASGNYGSAEGRIDGDRVSVPGSLVEWALQVAPSEVAVYDRRGNLAFRLPGDTRFGTGVTALYYQDPLTDQVEPFARRHIGTLARLGDGLSSFDVLSTPGIIQDVAPELADLFTTLEMMANTVKPLVILVSAERAFPATLDLLEHLHGELAAKPFVLPYFNPISPLVINKGTVDKMQAAIASGLPIIYSNYGMSGASTPITPAGTLALLNAELLAGLVLSQLMKEGAPVILGSLPSCFDMAGAGSFYDPRSYLIDLAGAEMMAHYGLPHVGTSGSGIGWGPDLIAAAHQWMNHLLSCLGKVGLAPFVGDDLGAMAFSPAIAVYANDVVRQARILVEGFSLDDVSVAMSEIVECGPGGDFLTSPTTLQQFRSLYRSSIWPNMALEEWQAKGSPSAGRELRHLTQRLLAESKPPDDHASLMGRGEAFIRLTDPGSWA